jgi:hypothetical protein
MKNQPIGIGGKESLNPLPAPRLTMLLKHQKRVVSGMPQVPAMSSVIGQADKAVQKIIASIWI